MSSKNRSMFTKTSPCKRIRRRKIRTYNVPKQAVEALTITGSFHGFSHFLLPYTEIII
jgi:hypothetical protein